MYPHRKAPPRCAESPPTRRALAHSLVRRSETAASGVRVAPYAACWDCGDVYMEGPERFAQLRSILLELNQLPTELASPERIRIEPS